MNRISRFIKERLFKRFNRPPVKESVVIFLADEDGLSVCSIWAENKVYTLSLEGSETFEYYKTIDLVVDRAMQFLPNGGFIYVVAYYQEESKVLYNDSFLSSEKMRKTIYNLLKGY